MPVPADPGITKGIIGQVQLSLTGSLGGDQNDAGRRPGAVDRRRSRVFQHRNVLHVAGVDVVDVIDRYAVDDDERVAVTNGGHAPNEDVGRGAGRIIVPGDHHAGDRAL